MVDVSVILSMRIRFPMRWICCARLGILTACQNLQQKLTCIYETFVRGQSNLELKKYLWGATRTQSDRKLHTLIEVCIHLTTVDLSSNVHDQQKVVCGRSDSLVWKGAGSSATRTLQSGSWLLWGAAILRIEGGGWAGQRCVLQLR